MDKEAPLHVHDNMMGFGHGEMVCKQGGEETVHYSVILLVVFGVASGAVPLGPMEVPSASVREAKPVKIWWMAGCRVGSWVLAVAAAWFRRGWTLDSSRE